MAFESAASTIPPLRLRPATLAQRGPPPQPVRRCSRPSYDPAAVDFNRVYAEYIAPAIDAAGLEPFRADEELRAGEIRADMFQELLIADLVVADLTIDNPNVWYELGVRHALRARGVVLVSGSSTKAFDVYTDRKLRYGLANGGPDPATLEADKRRLTAMIKETMQSWHERKVSPVYALMPNLQEPDWKSLRVGGVQEFWQKHQAWETRLDLARKAGRIGDVLVLAEEAPVAAFRAEAWTKAGATLRRAERFDFALEHLDKALALEPENLGALREKGICLQRLALEGRLGHSLERARAHYRDVLARCPTDTETWALLGRVDKDAWTTAWRRSGSTPEQMRADAVDQETVLRAAIDSYARAFRGKPAHYYSGINALTLMHLYRHLTSDGRYDRDLAIMSGAVRFAAESEHDDGMLFWSKATLGDLEVLGGSEPAVKAAYREAIVKNAQDWFALSSSRSQLEILRQLGFNTGAANAGIATFDNALHRLKKPDEVMAPRQVILFSGHMIDAPDRETPRFPADKEAIAKNKIAEALDKLGADARDIAFSQAAAGGDLLFLEACQKRGVRSHVHLPFAEPEFIDRSIIPSKGGDVWRERYFAMKAQLEIPICVMPDELGPLPKAASPFERCNLWLLYSALACGVDKVRFVTLWNGGGGDGPGGTAHMYESVKRHTGHVDWIDTRTL